MKLLFLLTLLCSVTPEPGIPAKAKKFVTVDANPERTFDILPSGMFFQF